MAILREARDLAQAQATAPQTDALVGQPVTDRASVEHGGLLLEVTRGDAATPAFPIGQDSKAGGDELLEQLGAPPAAVEDDGHAPLADKRADFLQHDG